jgi:hypothetical protein
MSRVAEMELWLVEQGSVVWRSVRLWESVMGMRLEFPHWSMRVVFAISEKQRRQRRRVMWSEESMGCPTFHVALEHRQGREMEREVM